MTTRPEALRLAEAIDPLTRYTLDNLTCSAAASELRRLHEENAAFRREIAALSANALDDYKEIERLKAAQPAQGQKPVACAHCNGSGRMVRDPDIGTDQECFVCEGSGFYEDFHPQPKQWVGLTDEEIKPLCDENHIIYGAYTVDFIQSIEAKLKEKNT